LPPQEIEEGEAVTEVGIEGGLLIVTVTLEEVEQPPLLTDTVYTVVPVILVPVVGLVEVLDNPPGPEVDHVKAGKGIIFAKV